MRRGMRYPAHKKREIIRLVEPSHLLVLATLEKLGITRAPFYRWYDADQGGGPEARADRPSRPCRVWNRLPTEIRDLERLTEPSDLVDGDEACGEAGEGLVDVGASLVADGQAAETIEPSVGALILSLSKDRRPSDGGRASGCTRCLCGRCAARSRAPDTPGGV